MKVDLIIPDLREIQQDVDQAVLETPTGAKRNLLTDANIHLLLALEKLDQVGSTP